ncbi:hypothetical protein HMI55_001813 [Coelomomyces lativittatus]|nr:hypothetical protein HMI56_001998 [Coelomomyces lativittatus]KAJ1504906.1 hypothetical protein HMI55_001813 [Coelomomyces lativittatus]
MFVGRHKGFPTTQRTFARRPANSKGRVSKKTKFVRSVVQEVVGFAPYEKRIMELLKNSRDKRARKLAKKRLGTLRQAKRKVEYLSNIVTQSRRAH